MKTEAEQNRELRLKYAEMGRDLGYLNKKDVDAFRDESRVRQWEIDYLNDKHSASGRAREAGRRQAGAQIQAKLSRMAIERGHLDSPDCQEFESELDAGQVEDKRGRPTGTRTYFMDKNPLSKK